MFLKASGPLLKMGSFEAPDLREQGVAYSSHSTWTFRRRWALLRAEQDYTLLRFPKSDRKTIDYVEFLDSSYDSFLHLSYLP